MDLRQRILEKLAEWEQDEPRQRILLLIRALREAVEPHEEWNNDKALMRQPGYGDPGEPYCRACDSNDADWPCFALKRIAAGLGLEG